MYPNLFPLLVVLLVSSQLAAQQPALSKWWVEFSDKNDSPYCTCRPAEFLSARALERRARAGIGIEENDLPVNPGYVRALTETGVLLHNTSRWLNTATVIADSAAAAVLTGLPFVRGVRYLGPDIPVRNPPDRPTKQRVPIDSIPTVEGDQSGFGYAGLQNSLLGIPLVHAAGYRGAGIWVVVMDGGFTNVDTLPFFDSIALNGRLYQGRDFVERDGAVFESAQHGTSVLSVMAADLPGYFVGTAPEATYFLVKTEDTGGEFPVEETNWIAGAEWADSIGADIINASLGYTVFNDTTLSHTFAVLDGRTAIGSRGAAIAATKGMIVCNSAGNSGDEPWTYLGVPADAPGVVAVGAVSPDGSRATFSSQGPTADGRIKPDLMAPGETVVVAGDTGTDLGLSNGTSLASPMLAGALAALWSAFPNKTAAEILDAAFVSADQTLAPDTLRGYGMPDMARAWLTLGGYLHGDVLNNARAGFFAFDRDAGALSFLLFGNTGTAPPEIELRNLFGQKMQTGAVAWRNNNVVSLKIEGLNRLSPGFYQVVIRAKGAPVRLVSLVW
jgi:serine protease AprX